jgi:hypothetical protein
MRPRLAAQSLGLGTVLLGGGQIAQRKPFELV